MKLIVTKFGGTSVGTIDRIKSVATRIKKDKILFDLNDGYVIVVPGFQGVHKNRLTTLGRGGSDTSAVALAAVFGAERCDIYTDVDGVYTADPRIVANALKLETITFEEMLELASQLSLIHI